MINLECLGCRIANQIEPDVQVVYENNYITCVLDIAPFNEGHVLILPKTHYHDLEEIDEKNIKSNNGCLNNDFEKDKVSL